MSIRQDSLEAPPPPVPTTRGPSLPSGRQTPGGPPRTTPRRSTSRYSAIQHRGNTQRYPATGPTRIITTRGQEGASYGARIRIKPAREEEEDELVEGNNNNFMQSNKSEVGSSETSTVFEVLRDASALRDDHSSIHFEVVDRSISGNSKFLQGSIFDKDEMLQEKLEGLGTPPQVQGQQFPSLKLQLDQSAPRSSSSLRLEVLAEAQNVNKNNNDISKNHNQYNSNNNNNNTDVEDAESLPTAMPPPTPHPAVRSATNNLCYDGTAMSLKYKGANITEEDRYGTHDKILERNVNPTPLVTTHSALSLTPKVYSLPAPQILQPTVCFLPPPILQSPKHSLQEEVNAWMNLIKSLEDVSLHKLYLQNTEKYFHEIKRDIESLASQLHVTDSELHDAKKRYIESLDNYDRLRRETREKKQTVVENLDNVNNNDYDNNNEEDEFAREREAWRIEKGELLAQKAVLLQKRNELQHHLRRGTNIKNVAGVMRGAWGSQERETESNGFEDNEGSIPPTTDDIEIIQMRLEMKESHVRFMKLVDTHRILKETRRSSQREFEDECNILRHTAAAARNDVENWRSALQASISEAEQLWNASRKSGEGSLAVLLEHGIEEAKAALKQNENSPAVGEIMRSGMPSLTRSSSLTSTPYRGTRSTTGTITLVTRPSRIQ